MSEHVLKLFVNNGAYVSMGFDIQQVKPRKIYIKVHFCDEKVI